MLNSEKGEDRTKLEKLEALGHFAGGIAHDFNNILSVIDGCTHMALQQLERGTLKPEHLRRILLSTERGAGLARQLLAFGRRDIHVGQKTDLRAFLLQMQDIFRLALGERVHFSMDLPAEAAWVFASQDQVTQIVLNLVLNARDAVNSCGEVFLNCSFCLDHSPSPPALQNSSNNYVRISVGDNGCGIPASALPHIFKPFFTTKGKSKGTGLGLCVVQEVVHYLSGHIDVQSEPHDGTVFNIFLPCAEPPESATGANEENEGSYGNKRG